MYNTNDRSERKYQFSDGVVAEMRASILASEGRNRREPWPESDLRRPGLKPD